MQLLGGNNMLVFAFKKCLLCNFLLVLIFLFMTDSMAFAKKNEASIILPISTAEFPPFKFTEHSSGKIIGFDTEIMTEVFKSMGITPQIHMLPFKRADLETRIGNYAAYYTFTKNDERLKDYYYSNPISAVQDFIFFKKSRNISWDKYEDLMNYRLGYSQKYNYDNKFIETIKKKYPILHEKNEKLLLTLLANDRVDMIICEVSVCSYLIKKNPEKFHLHRKNKIQ